MERSYDVELTTNGVTFYGFALDGNVSCADCLWRSRTSKELPCSNCITSGVGRICFWQPAIADEAEKPLSERVREWLEAGEYVVDTRPNWNGCCRVWHGLKRIMFADGEDANITFSNNQIKDDSTILHHGDAISTITWICEQGYECEIRFISGEVGVVTVVNGDFKTIINGIEHTWYDFAGLNPGITITRFYRPAPAETDAQKILRLADEGNTVEYRANHNGNFCVVNKCNGKYYLRDITPEAEECKASELSPDVTYLAHYREPSVEDVLKAMDSVDKGERHDLFSSFNTDTCGDFWQYLQDAYAIARWKLIESNPENNVSLD